MSVLTTIRKIAKTRAPIAAVLPARRTRLSLMAALCLVVSAAVQLSHASGPVDVYRFDNNAQKARYQTLIAEFRCPKCLNTDIAGSDAPIAKDLRKSIHRMLVDEGRTDEEIRDFLHERYGDFVLYRPPLKPSTWIIWFLPLLLGVVGVVLVVRMVRGASRRGVAAESMSEVDRERLRNILDRHAEDARPDQPVGGRTAAGSEGG